MGWHSGQFTGRSALQSRFLWRFPVEGSPVTAIVRANRLQPGEPVAPAGVAEEDRELVADESTAAAGEDRRPPGEARAVLLAAAGGKRTGTAAVRQHGAKD